MVKPMVGEQDRNVVQKQSAKLSLVLCVISYWTESYRKALWQANDRLDAISKRNGERPLFVLSRFEQYQKIQLGCTIALVGTFEPRAVIS
jgi:hypothetical protein